MTKPAFTPGPWRIEQRPSSGYGASSAPYEICASGSQSMTIALLNGRESSEISANARLIAAAPDMYDALVVLSSMSGVVNLGKRVPAIAAWLDEALAAIAKAEGRT